MMTTNILLLLSSIVIIIGGLPNEIQGQWHSDGFQSMHNNWLNMMGNSHRINSMPTFGSLDMRLPERESAAEPLHHQEFDPSVVVVDKGSAEDTEAEPSHESESENPFDMDFPLTMGFNRPNFWSFGLPSSRQKPWWKGPNVCIEKKVIKGDEAVISTKTGGLEVEDQSPTMNMQFQSFGSNLRNSLSLQSTSCSESDTSYTCVSKLIKGRENTTTIVKRQCCHGFFKDTSTGCTKMNLKSLVETMKDLNANRMLKLIERFGMSNILVADNITVLAVIDESLIELEDNVTKDENEVETQDFSYPSAVRRRRETNTMPDSIAMHLLPGFVRSGDMNDDVLVPTLSPSKQQIRFNVYHTHPRRVVTANCVPLVSTNNYAINGIVHIVNRVMPSPTKTLKQIIENDDRFTILGQILSKTNLMDQLNDSKQHITLLAPTDEAFRRLDSLYLERLLKGQSCVDALLNNHIIGDTLCLSAVQEFASVRNRLEKLLPIKRVNQKVEINGINVVESDQLATNGVIHVIDGVISSVESQPISKFLEKHQLTDYMKLLNDSGLLSEWDGLTNVSFFIPSKNAMRSLSQPDLDRIRNNTRDLIGYHVVPTKSEVCDWTEDQLMRTMSDKNQMMRINMFGSDILGFSLRPVVTAQCAPIIAPNQDICGASIYVVDRFLQPSKGTLLQTLDSMENLSIIRQIVQTSGIQEQLTANGTYTLLAPDDETVRNYYSVPQINSMVSNQNESEKFIKRHLFGEIICCSGVNNSPLFLSSQEFRNLDGKLVSAHRSFAGRVRFGTAQVTRCDQMADNGVVHVINRVLTRKRPEMSSSPISHDFSFPLQFVF
ncbi:transforming growth factor-beta-induced protein ig-h3-like [Oppia nitens]|uniref:transforming growth factor-beta-induced protein ig-h3-like n=1 Tax=Oppia nitens TaxID=1686743 RepID=UPI0023DA3E95|nr:transforming growth factor-beta-induced protein ig-h3-like [Oppia nitens]